MNNQSKQQLMQCLIDLSHRFGELGDRNTQASLYVLIASLTDNTEDMLAEWMAAYAEMRLAMERDAESS